MLLSTNDNVDRKYMVKMVESVWNESWVINVWII